MPPQALQIGSAWHDGAPSFVQQGQVDWVAFGNTVWSASAAMLQRFASSGIHTVTYGAGLALASQFRLSSLGRHRMDETMQSLRGVPVLDKLLWFGFGHQSFVKILAENQQGLKCIALCSCLTEAHSEETAARVLEELWKLNGFPDTYEPSHFQFIALIKACSGVVARSSFGEVLDAMTGHGLWMFGRDRVYCSVLKASNARDIARAMKGLFKITTGEAEAITLVGQNECAFIAAFGHWLFDLAIYIEDDLGRVLFRSKENLSREGAQVLVTYTDEDQPAALQQSTTYVLPVGTDLCSRYVSTSESRWILKIPWDGCLARTFGSAFRRLSGQAHILGSYLGCTARIHAALAAGEPHVAVFSRARFIEFSQLSHGQGFIHSVTSIFKELERIPGLHDSMERTLSSNFDHALKELEQAAQMLMNTCPCDICSGRSSSDLESSPGHGEASGVCLVALAMTIRSLVTALASTIRDEALPVAVYGLQSYYSENNSIYVGWAAEGEHKRTLAAMFVGLPSVTDSNEILVPKPQTLLSNIRPLFDGSLSTPGSDALKSNTATASSGICCYRECLQGLSAQAGAMRLLHVIPGLIERGSAQYDFVSDGALDDRISSLSEPVAIAQVDPKNPKCEAISLGTFEVSALATESSTYRELAFFYKIVLPDGSVTQIQPGRFSNHVLERTGLLSCHRSKKCKQELAFPCSAIRRGWSVEASDPNLQYNAQTAICVWSYQEAMARCVAFATQNQGSFIRETTFLRRDECLPCSSESIVRESPSIVMDVEIEQEVTHII